MMRELIVPLSWLQKQHVPAQAPVPAKAPTPPLPKKVFNPVQTGPYGGTGGTGFRDDSKGGKITGIAINAGMLLDGICIRQLLINDLMI